MYTVATLSVNPNQELVFYSGDDKSQAEWIYRRVLNTYKSDGRFEDTYIILTSNNATIAYERGS